MRFNHFFIPSLAVLLLLFTAGAAGEQTVRFEPVKPGIENIDRYLYLFKDKRVGLITNQTGVDRLGNSSIDLLRQKVNLTALFSPEHGLRGRELAGNKVASGVDAKTGLPVFSLYGETRKPTPEMLENVDVLCFDMQDVGARFYTYISTMAYAMESCRAQDKLFVVFDRPNPLGGEIVEGPVLKPGYESFIGLFPIPVRHGLTVGELACYFNEEQGIQAKLAVVEMSGWRRWMFWEDTGLVWIPTSPNIPTSAAALVYPGSGIIGETNISAGVGTARPFELLGADWLNGEELADRLNSLKLPGVYFRPTVFTPDRGKQAGLAQQGVEIQVVDKYLYRPVYSAARVLDVIRQLGGRQVAVRPESNFDLAVGENTLRRQQEPLTEMLQRWQREAHEFKQLSQNYYLYP